MRTFAGVSSATRMRAGSLKLAGVYSPRPHAARSHRPARGFAAALAHRRPGRWGGGRARLEEAVEQPERAVIQKVRAGQEEAMAVVADIANLVRDSKIEAATRVHSTREDPLYRSIDALVSQMVQQEDARMVRLRDGMR